MNTQLIGILKGLLAVMGLAVIMCAVVTAAKVGLVMAAPATVAFFAGIYLVYCSFKVERYVGSVSE